MKHSMPPPARTALKILAHVAAVAGIVLLFYVSLGAGLQVSPLYGNIGISAVVVLAGLYIYIGFIRNR